MEHAKAALPSAWGIARRAVLIGLDSATLDLLKRFADKGRLPNLKRLMERGVTTEAFSSLPPATSTNWNTIATGAHAGTHGVVAMAIHKPGGRLDELESAFFSHHCRAERIWQVAERMGRKPLLLKYTASWPPTIEKGIQVAGFADPDWNVLALAPRCAYSTRKLASLPEGAHTVTAAPPRTMPMGFQVELGPAGAWQDVPSNAAPALEASLPLTTTTGEPETLYTLVTASGEGGYDRAIIAETRSCRQPLADLRVGEWSEWIRRQFSTANGREEGWVRFKLIALAPDASDFLLFQSQIFPTTGWTVPDGLAETLVERLGPFQELGGVCMPLWWGWTTPEQSEDLFVEEMEYQVKWLSEAADYLMRNNEWDLLATQWHGIDHMDHSFITALDPNHKLHELATRVLSRTYELADEFVGAILRNVDEDTLVVVTSDHGHAARVGAWLDVNDLLEKRGLLVYKDPPPQTRLEDGGYAPPTVRRVDWSRTKAGVAHDGYVYVNLKGREAHGIVEPEDYEAVVEEVVDVLEDARSPTFTDRRYCEIVLRREEAEVFGLNDELVGDVVFFAKVRLKGSHHGCYHASRAKIGSLRAVSIFAGPGIKSGVETDHAINLIDIAPTMAVLLGMPAPAQSEGKVLWGMMKGTGTRSG
jgi:predicted AlkP superfamily phosphohydrolase/phosphomutase